MADMTAQNLIPMPNQAQCSSNFREVKYVLFLLLSFQRVEKIRGIKMREKSKKKKVQVSSYENSNCKCFTVVQYFNA